MRQKTKNYRIRGSNAQQIFFKFYFPSHIPIWVWSVQKTQAKNSHAWAPLTKHDRDPLFGHGNTFDRGLPVVYAVRTYLPSLYFDFKIDFLHC